MPGADVFKHVVVLMLENHSFDQMLGALKEENRAIDGFDINADAGQGREQLDLEGFEARQAVAQLKRADYVVDPDPVHEYPHVLRQLDKRFGFVVDYAQSYPKTGLLKRQDIMDVYPRGSLPVLHELARNFCVCNKWFSSLPGPTWPNRFFVHSGTSMGHVDMPSHIYDKGWHCYDQETVYTRLSQRNIPWKIYHHGMPQTLVMVKQWEHLTHYCGMEKFFADAAGAEADFPAYAFIEPCYSGADRNDQHPPSDVRWGEVLIAKVYNALRNNEALWKTVLFVVLYDEHGGFYDHVLPPPQYPNFAGACPPDDEHKSAFAFDQLGVRVPAILISPWIIEGSVNNDILDHTSLLKFAKDRWGLGDLRRRTDAAISCIDGVPLGPLRPDCPKDIATVHLEGQATANAPGVIDDHLRALISFSHSLEGELARLGEDVEEIGQRSLKTLEGVGSQIAVAAERFGKFFERSRPIAG